MAISAKITSVGPRVGQRPAEDVSGSFLRMVSHELRTPLNSIIGFSEILTHELCGPLGSPQYKEYAGLIWQSGHRLLKLINQIVEIVRLQDHNADLDIGPEPLEPIIDQVLAALADEAAARDQTLSPPPASGPWPTVLADPRALNTVLTNLLQNAITFSPPGGEIRVRLGRQKDKVLIEVQDDGPGVALEDIDRILRPFEQGEHPLTRSSQGAGLVLPIVRLLCEAMGGRLEIRSGRGRGLTAVAALPAA